ncbi:MAG: class I mannose-6-phosphate isomerase [Simkaniaceae bacterium]|nr:class I mannose-6-phosphate isomerase [Simkaniaceae bacterium]
MKKTLYPIHFEPIYKNYVWGGQKIIECFDRQMPSGIYAESWEISDRDEGMSIVANGFLRGMSLRELCRSYGKELLGSDYETFPLLIKLIDAKQNLSVQVHPDEEHAKKYGGDAKTEALYIINASSNAYIYSGLKTPLTEHALIHCIHSNQLINHLNKIPVKTGDAYIIPGGEIHAIGKGSLIFEVQQNSNTTYRIYDWERNRPLHIKQALEVMRRHEPLKTNRLTGSINTPYFTLEKECLSNKTQTFALNHHFEMVFCLTGEGTINQEKIKAGMSFFIPASLKTFTVCSTKPLSFLRVKPQDPLQ